MSVNSKTPDDPLIKRVVEGIEVGFSQSGLERKDLKKIHTVPPIATFQGIWFTEWTT